MPSTIISAEAGSSHGKGCSEERQRGSLVLAKLARLLSVGLEPLQHARHLLLAEDDGLAGERCRPILPAQRLDFDRKPQRPVEIGSEADLPVVGEKAGAAPFERLEHG